MHVLKLNHFVLSQLVDLNSFFTLLSYIPLHVFSNNSPKQNATSLLTPGSDTYFYALLCVVACILFYMAAPETAYFKDSDWLLKNFNQ